jgi:hypothetical protein
MIQSKLGDIDIVHPNKTIENAKSNLAEVFSYIYAKDARNFVPPQTTH